MRFLLVVSLLLVSGAVEAEDAKERAAKLSRSAVELGRSGEYAAALSLFEQAYALTPEPVLLYNIGRVAEKLGDWKKAAGALRAFLAVEKDAEKRAKAEETLVAVSAHLPAYVMVSCAVPGAEIVLDGRLAGHAPLQGPLEVPPGRHLITVQAPAKRPFEQSLEVRGAESIEVAARLEDEVATLQLVIEPSAARVVMDGIPVGADRRGGLSLSPGIHALRVELEGYETTEQRFEVAGREKKNVTVALTKKKVEAPVAPVVASATVLAKTPASPAPVTSSVDVPKLAGGVRSEARSPWYEKWWVWTAVGAVAAGGVTAAVLLTRPSGARSAADGDMVVQ